MEGRRFCLCSVYAVFGLERMKNIILVINRREAEKSNTNFFHVASVLYQSEENHMISGYAYLVK